MIPEPDISPDDTNPHKPVGLEERLRREEPPINKGDTSPSRPLSLEEHLRQQEPPISSDDTSPSILARQPLPTRSAGRSQRFIAVFMLLAAFGLTAVAALIWLDSEDENSVPEQPVIVAENPGDVTLPAAETNTAPTATQMAEVESAAPDTPVIFPTAAADEIAVALLTPAAIEPKQDVIVRNNEPFTVLPLGNRSEVVQYTVQQGDTLESITNKFGLNDFWTLIWSNKRSKYSPLRPGVQLNILPEDGVYHEVTETVTISQLAEKYSVDPYAIIDSEYNDQLFGATPDNVLPEGLWVVVPGGQGEKLNLLAAKPNEGTGSAGTSSSVGGTYTLWGCTSNVAGGSLPYGRPLDNYTWMQGLRPGAHDGVDLAANAGTPVYASGSGTVAFSGWNNYGFGNVVVIAHGPVFSIYGHLLRTSVNCGDQVAAGSVIGLVGSTGNSSGNHLHFELRDANWGLLNPQNYVGF
jgi:murein DD-endopeptidase MepM/ murein hydrolase activator NlpD